MAKAMTATPRRRRPASNALAAVAGRQWAIERDALETIKSVARRTNMTPEAIEAIRGEPLDNTHEVTIRDGVASIPVRGPLFRYASFFTRCSGATAYADLATDFRAAIDNPMIRAILLVIDSPGGEVNGCAELAAMIYAARGIKPIVAYVSGQGTSAAYWIASAADEVVIANTAILGSLGCIWGMETVRNNDQTVEEYVLVSSQSPRKNVDVRTEEGRADLQVMLDALADVFLTSVAEYRAVTIDDVLGDFGQGGMFVGEAAIAPGLADRLGSYEDVLAELSGRASSPAALPAFGGRASTTLTEGSMTKNNASAGRRSAPRGSAAAASDPPAKDAKDEKDKTGDEADAASDTPADEEEKPAAKKPAAAADDPEDEGDDGADEEEENADGTKKKASDADAHATAIVKAKADERERITKIRALAGPADFIQACVDDAECTPEAAAYRLMTRDAGKPKGASRLAQLHQDDAAPHASATPAAPTSTTARDAAKASVDRFLQLTQPTKRTP